MRAELSRLLGSGQYGRLSPHQSASRTASPPREKPLGNTAQFPPDGLSTAPADLRAKSRRKRRLRSEAPRCGSVCGTSLAVSALRSVSLKKVTHNRMRSQCHFAEIYRKFAIEIIFLI